VTTTGRLRSVLVLFSYWRMADTDPMPDPESPEWTIAWTIKRELRTHWGPKFKRFLPRHLALEITKALRQSKWRLVKDPPSPPHSTPGE
jgi:hypothetical protein